jgi:DNA-binding response OmpR family regulator
MKILIVEDEPSIRKNIVQFLSGEGYLVESANTYKEGLEKVKIYAYDCCLLDIMLPDGSGLDLINHIKSKNLNTGIIVLSAKSAVEDKIKGLNYGADDYLAKPFHLQELNARIKSILRRRQFGGSHILESKNIKIDIDARKICINNQDTNITGKEYEILVFLLTNKNKVLSKEAIAEHIWGDFVDQSDTLDFLYTHIKNLRKKMQQYAKEDYIKSIYGIGYKLEDE